MSIYLIFFLEGHYFLDIQYSLTGAAAPGSDPLANIFLGVVLLMARTNTNKPE